MLQPVEDPFLFLCTCIPATVDHQADGTALFQQCQRGFQCRQGRLRFCRDTVVASRQITQVKHDQIRRFRLHVIRHPCMAVQDQPGVAVSFPAQPFACMFNGFLLNIESKDLSFRSHVPAQKFRIISVAHGRVNADASL